MKSAELMRRFDRRYPSRFKNPRDLKKAWKRIIVAQVVSMAGRNGENGRYTVRWVPGDGWFVEIVTKKEKVNRGE